MGLTLVPTSEAYFPGLYQALDAVAREKRYLVFAQAPPMDAALEFFRHIVAHGLCQRLAVEEDAVLGWCDVLPKPGDACAHVGVLGMGLIPEARHRGIGALLLSAGLEAARRQGFSRIELQVRIDNANAIALYKRFGFQVEGVLRRAYRLDGHDFDVLAMALLA